MRAWPKLSELLQLPCMSLWQCAAVAEERADTEYGILSVHLAQECMWLASCQAAADLCRCCLQTVLFGLASTQALTALFAAALARGPSALQQHAPQLPLVGPVPAPVLAALPVAAAVVCTWGGLQVALLTSPVI